MSSNSDTFPNGGTGYQDYLECARRKRAWIIAVSIKDIEIIDGGAVLASVQLRVQKDGTVTRLTGGLAEQDDLEYVRIVLATVVMALATGAGGVEFGANAMEELTGGGGERLTATAQSMRDKGTTLARLRDLAHL